VRAPFGDACWPLLALLGMLVAATALFGCMVAPGMAAGFVESGMHWAWAGLAAWGLSVVAGAFTTVLLLAAMDL